MAKCYLFACLMLSFMSITKGWYFKNNNSTDQIFLCYSKFGPLSPIETKVVDRSLDDVIGRFSLGGTMHSQNLAHIKGEDGFDTMILMMIHCNRKLAPDSEYRPIFEDTIKDILNECQFSKYGLILDRKIDCFVQYRVLENWKPEI